MAWMMDEYSTLAGKQQFGVITGKPLPLGGSPGRGDATARGGMFTVREAAKELKIDLKKATVAVHGYGNAGYYAAQLAQKMFGSRVITVCDSKGGVVCETNIDAEEAQACKMKTGSVCNMPGLKK